MNEIFEKLRKYETHLRRGFFGGYIYGLYQKDFDELLVYYKALGGRENLKYSCSACTLRLVRFVGKLYFEEAERRKVAEREKEQEPIVEQPDEKQLEEHPKKRTRKKKEAE